MSAGSRLTNMVSSRRSVLRGMLGGTAVTVGLPFLDCMLNTNGTALAATGAPLPLVFGTYFWGCGLNPGRWEPATVGKGYDFGTELQPLAAYRDKINLFSGLKVFLDGKGGSDLGGSAAQSVILMIIVVILTAVQFRYVEKKVHY